MTKVTVNISSECSDEAVNAIFKRVKGISEAVGDIDLTVNVSESKPAMRVTTNPIGNPNIIDAAKDYYAKARDDIERYSSKIKQPKPEKRPINELIDELVNRRAELPSAWFSEHKPELKGNTFIDFRFTWVLKGKKPTPPPAD
jgi:hypothetical protein